MPSETVEDIVREILKVAHNVAISNKETLSQWRPAAFLRSVADRIEAAYKREVEKLREQIEVIDLARKISVGMNDLAIAEVVRLKRKLNNKEGEIK